MNIEKLITEFVQFDTNKLNDYKELISSKYNDEIFPPYIPHIGRYYHKYKIMMYGMAQSIIKPWSLLINKTRTEKVRQIYDAPTFNDIWIGPYRVMLALAGMYIYAQYGVPIEKFEDIHLCVAATNYYKFSLSLSGNDVNPDKDLPKYQSPDTYWEENDQLSLLELNFLKPNVIISFNGRHNEAVSRSTGVKPIKINDPSWILQGGGGVLNKAGRWYREINDSMAHKLTNSYVEQIDSHYSGKKNAIKVYLLKYYDDWKNCFPLVFFTNGK